MEAKKLTKTLNVLKSPPPALASLAANGDDGQWVWATREIVDIVGDVIRVDGVRFDEYHNPPEQKLKILASHLMALPDGRLPVVATVEQVVKTTTTFKGKLVKGIALYCRWLRDPETGELLELAKHYKQMVDAGGVDSVSVGVRVDEFAPIPETGGLDITKCCIYECSYVLIPANPAANVVKHLIDDTAVEADRHRTKELVPCDIDPNGLCTVEGCCTRRPTHTVVREFGDDHAAEMPPMTPKEEAFLRAKELELMKAQYRSILARAKDLGVDLAAVAAEQAEPDAPAQRVGGDVFEAVASATAPMLDAIKALTDAVRSFDQRLDTLESAVVVLTQSAPARSEDDTPDAGQDEDDAEKLAMLAKRLDGLARFVSK